MFERLIQNLDVLKEYHKIESREKNRALLKHDLKHVQNVTHYIESILSQLDVEEDFIEAAKIAAMLHDIGYTKGKEDHAFYSYVWASEYFRTHNIILPYHTEVLYAIRDHCDLYHSISLMTISLILADKLDITKERLTQKGMDAQSVSLLQYVNDIQLQINQGQLIVLLDLDEAIDVDDLFQLNHVKNLKKAILSFAKHQNLTPILKINHNPMGLNQK